MISQEFRKYQENRFDSFCRKVIRNACMDNRKGRMKREKRFSSLEAMQVEALDLERVEDAYVTYSRTYKVKGIDITITDERIGEAIQFIMPNQRAVLLLSFFKEYSDMDIARLMKISHKTVAYRKQMAMKKLRILLEGTEDGR